MTHQQAHALTERMTEAIAELELLVLQDYPEATFRIEYGIDDPEAIHLVAFVEFEDAFDVLNRVSERMMAIQVDQGVPIFVIPMRPDERTLSMLAAGQQLPDLQQFHEASTPSPPFS